MALIAPARPIAVPGAGAATPGAIGASPSGICRWSFPCCVWTGVPSKIAGWLRLYRIFNISHQTIYRHIWYDRCYGGRLHAHLRQASKKRRKRYRRPDSRGILPNKRHISERPPGAQHRSRFGHWESDTVMGAHDRHCIVTLVERQSKYVIIGKLRARTADELNRKVIALIQREQPTARTITADNGTEFHSYTTIENETGARF
jgi:IS30 family transposase